jgi:uncharacterized protein (DUF2147 family)
MFIAWRRLSVAALVLTASAAIVAPAAVAQDVQYITVTKVDLGGALNAIARLGGVSETRDTTYIKGKKYRTDSDKRSVIFDLDNDRFITVNHEAKTYTVVPIADMMAAAAAPARAMKADASKDQLKGTAVDSAGNKADFIVNLKVEPTKERRNIEGNDAERVLVTMETNVHVTPQGQSASEEAGTLVILMDSWNANTGPAADVIRAWEQAASKELAAAAFGRRANMGPAFSANPGMAEAMKKAQEEAQKVEGIEVLSTTHLVIVAPGKKFDRDLALKGAGGAPGSAAEPEKKRGGLRGMIGKAIESSRQQQEEKPAEDVSQGTLAKVTTRLLGVKPASLPASLFEPPAAYRAVNAETTR